MIRRPPRSTLFPSPPLFRSRPGAHQQADVRPLEGGGGIVVYVGSRQQGKGAVLELHRGALGRLHRDRKSTRLNSSHSQISYAVFCLKKKKKTRTVAEYARSH